MGLRGLIKIRQRDVADEATKSDEAILLEEIRDLLKKQK